MPIDIDADKLKQGVLSLVIALVEIIRDTLRHQALRRMESGSLNEQEIERLGRTLKELDAAIEQIKEDQGVAESVQSVRDGLDDIVDDAIHRIAYPEETNQEVNYHG